MYSLTHSFMMPAFSSSMPPQPDLDPTRNVNFMLLSCQHSRLMMYCEVLSTCASIMVQILAMCIYLYPTSVSLITQSQAEIPIEYLSSQPIFHKPAYNRDLSQNLVYHTKCAAVCEVRTESQVSEMWPRTVVLPLIEDSDTRIILLYSWEHV